jgi:hypothetical protein
MKHVASRDCPLNFNGLQGVIFQKIKPQILRFPLNIDGTLSIFTPVKSDTEDTEAALQVYSIRLDA